jgi:hypothetical protein
MMDGVGGIQWRSRSVHHIRFVEARMLDRVAAIAHMDERSLRQCRQQIVRGLRGEHGRAGMLRRITVHRKTLAIDRIEARVAVPRFIEVNAIDTLIE